MKKRKIASRGSGLPVRQAKDVSNRNILKDPTLCSQFLKDYVDSELFKDLRPEDIEDVSEKYQAYLGITFETDTVKKICMKGRENAEPLYLISLVEHKSQVDYNVSMQILKYMTCIWNEYGKEMTSKGWGDIRNKNFRYPPILPIVYYEGKDNWTADIHLKDRIFMKELFGNYIPDFTYKLVRIHDYSNEELLENEDEMSLLMMLGKAQTPEDIHRLIYAQKDKVDLIVRKAPEHVLEIIAVTVWSLCMKMNVPQEEAEQCVQKVRERQMGYWFENMEKMDIQEERRNTAKAREDAAKAKADAAKAKADADKAKADANKAKADVSKAQANALEKNIQSIVSVCKKHGISKEKAVVDVMENCQIDQKTAESKVNQYWEK